MATMTLGMNMVRLPAFDLGGPKTLRPPVPLTSASATASLPASRSSRPTRRAATSDQRRPSAAPIQIIGRYSSDTWAAIPATSSGVRVEAAGSLDRRQIDGAAWGPGQPVVAHGVAEHGPHDLVLRLTVRGACSARDPRP